MYSWNVLNFLGCTTYFYKHQIMEVSNGEDSDALLFNVACDKLKTGSLLMNYITTIHNSPQFSDVTVIIGRHILF